MKAIKKSLEQNKKSYGYAIRGIRVASNGNNFRYQVLAAFFVIILAFILKINLYEWIILVFCIGAVLMAEAFNTALELLVDLVSPEVNPIAGKVKDVAAGAVLIMAFGTLIIGTLIFLPKILLLIN